MKTRRFAVRLAASATLAAALTLGAHAFVPTAFGCSQNGQSTCRTAQTVTTFGYLDLDLIVSALGVLLP